jgi:hypothetical protein
MNDGLHIQASFALFQSDAIESTREVSVGRADDRAKRPISIHSYC